MSNLLLHIEAHEDIGMLCKVNVVHVLEAFKIKACFIHNVHPLKYCRYSQNFISVQFSKSKLTM